MYTINLSDGHALSTISEHDGEKSSVVLEFRTKTEAKAYAKQRNLENFNITKSVGTTPIPIKETVIT